jgi:hypothetical protein
MKTIGRAHALALAAVIAIATVGCGADGPEEAVFEAARGWTWDEAGPDGYAARGQLELGDFVRLGAAPHVPGFASFGALKDSCLFNEQTDALAPVAVSITNAMTRPARLSTRIRYGPAWIYGTNNGATELLLATSTPDGVACDWLLDSAEETDPSWAPAWEDVAAGATTERAFAYLIIRDYLVPDSPKGSPELRVYRSYLSIDARAGGWLESIDGPDPGPPTVFPESEIETGGFSLSGTRPPCGMASSIRCVR